MSASEPARSPMERHIQSAILAVVVALLIWVGTSLTELGKTIVVLQTQMGMVSTQMSTMYRASDAARDQKDNERALGALAQRVTALEEYHRAERRRP